jgi:PTS system nitrogen regulatory IIA component
VARLLRDPEITRKLRESDDADAIYAVLAMPSASSAA